MSFKRTILLVLILMVAVPLAAGDRVAQLTKVDGDVTIQRKGTETVDTARQLGPRVRNGSIFSGDLIRTADGSEATLAFADGSIIELRSGTELSVKEVDLSALVASGRKDKPVGRRIKVLAGDIWTNVVPNPEVATEFETPSGVAAVKGTTLNFSVDGSSTTIGSAEGSTELINPQSGLSVTVSGGQEVGIMGGGGSFPELQAVAEGSAPPENDCQAALAVWYEELVEQREEKGEDPDGTDVAIAVAETNSDPVEVKLPDGRVVTADPGTELAADSEGFGVQLSVRDGSIRVGGGAPVTSGGGMGYVNPNFEVTGESRASFATEEGSIEITNDEQGARFDLPEGYSVSVEDQPGGGVAISTGKDNPGPVAVDFGGQKAELTPGSDVEAESSGGDLEVAVESGEVTVTDDQGESQTVGEGESATSSSSDEEAETEGDGEVGEEEAKTEEEEEEEEESTGGEGEEAKLPDEEDDKDASSESLGSDGSEERESGGSETTSAPAANCSGCAIDDGAGGCIDIDSNCNSDPCIEGQTCSGGRCVGGRRLTSSENPNCEG